MTKAEPRLTREFYRLTPTGTESLEEFAYKRQITFHAVSANVCTEANLVVVTGKELAESLSLFNNRTDRIRLLNQVAKLVRAKFQTASAQERPVLDKLCQQIADDACFGTLTTTT